MVKQTVEAHGGKAWVESEIGKGTTLCIRLPPPLLKMASPIKLNLWVMPNAGFDTQRIMQKELALFRRKTRAMK